MRFRKALIILLAGFGFCLTVLLALVAIEVQSFEPTSKRIASKYTKLVPLVYSSRYNITAFGMEHLHPFDGSKYRKIRDSLVLQRLRADDSFYSPEPLTMKQLQIVHSQKYLDSLKSSDVVASILEVAVARHVPAKLLDWRILTPMRYASGGTLQACRFALDKGLSINIGGGYHHASQDSGGGFCVYCDIPIAIKLLQKENLIKSALIIDTDAHQGNGFAQVAAESSDIHVIDFYDDSIYPEPKEVEDMAIPLPEGVSGTEYLARVKEFVPEAIEKYKPDLIVYNAGSDVLDSDPLSSMRVSLDELKERDLYVVSQARKFNVPIAMVLAGGYSSESAQAQANSIKEIILKFDRH